MLIAGRYEIADPAAARLGRGSMGEVYRAHDRQLDRDVAVKVVRPEALGNQADIIERFRREGEALRKLDHPNIVAVLDTITSRRNGGAMDEEPAYYLVMEYIPGGSLEELLAQESRLSVTRTLELGLDLADALTRAHRLGIIHRDLKPGNVLLDADGAPRLSDFGLARVRGMSSLTQPGVIVGTIDYLSPEACNGEELDESSDIWSFGVMLWEMVCGVRPFKRDNLSQTLAAILGQELVNPSSRCPDAPPSLHQLLSLMLQKERARRIPSMRLVGAELETILYAVTRRADARSERKSWHLAPRGPGDDRADQPAVARMIARSVMLGTDALGHSALLLAYEAGEELSLDEPAASLLLRSALVHGEPARPWMLALRSPAAAAGALRTYYDQYPRPQVRGRIVSALADLPVPEADEALLAVAVTDDAPAVRSEAALVCARRGQREPVTSALVAQAARRDDPGATAAAAGLVALAAEYGMPPEAGPALRLQIGQAVLRERWRHRRGRVRQLSLWAAWGGGLMALYGLAVPTLVAITSPEDYAATVAFITPAAYVLISMLLFGLYGLAQGWLSGLLVGLADALRPRRGGYVGRTALGALSGLVFSLFFNAVMLLNEAPPPAEPGAIFSANVFYGLLLGATLALVIPPLGVRRRRRTQWACIVLAMVIVMMAVVPYTYVIFLGEAAVLLFSRLLMAAMLPLTIGLPFLSQRAPGQPLAGVEAGDS